MEKRLKSRAFVKRFKYEFDVLVAHFESLRDLSHVKKLIVRGGGPKNNKNNNNEIVNSH